MRRLLILLNAWLISGVLYDAGAIAFASEGPELRVLSVLGHGKDLEYFPTEGVLCIQGQVKGVSECYHAKGAVIRLESVTGETYELNEKFGMIKLIKGVY